MSNHSSKDVSQQLSLKEKLHGRRLIKQSGTILTNNTKNYGPISERFLPINDGSPDRKLFHSVQKQTIYPSPLFNLNDSIMGADISTQGSRSIAEDADLELANSVSKSTINTKILKGLETHVASALGLNTERLLNFKAPKSPKKQAPLTSEFHRAAILSLNNTTTSKISDTKDVPEVPFKVLDAPGLRNDYYSNLVCWAHHSDHIAAGLGSLVYIWSEKDGTIPLKPIGAQIVSALSYSSEDYLAVGTKDSRIFIYRPTSVNVFTHIDLRTNTSICSIKWVPNTHYFFIGNDVGELSLIELVVKSERNTNPPKLIGFLQLKVTLKCAQQQICGIDVNPVCKHLAVGANNNCSSIWDISNIELPVLLYSLKHDAAVKAVAFCPWVPNLLATGGGTRDKHIRFWHITSGTLISKHKTSGQVTAIVWSRSKKEILVTFGFGDTGERNNILAVYAYPSLELRIKVNAPADLRILSADISNDWKSVCASISDQSVRIYNIWETDSNLKLEVYDKGIYGSDIIETEEGINNDFSKLR